MKSIQLKLTVAILTLFLVALSDLGRLNYWKARNIITEIISQDLALMAVALQMKSVIGSRPVRVN